VQTEIAYNTIGSNQTWQNMLSPTVQRANNTTYTNTTGRTIMVMVSVSLGATTGYFYINGSIAAQIGGDNNNSSPFSVIIPAGTTYKVSTGVASWWELRS
jgi:hypothetical protein